MDVFLNALFLRLVESLIVALEGRGKLDFAEGHGTFEAYLPRPSSEAEQVTLIELILDGYLCPIRPGPIKTWVSSASTRERQVIEVNLFPLDEIYHLVIAYPVLNPRVKKTATTPP